MSMTSLTLHAIALCEIDNARFVRGGQLVLDYCHLLLFLYYRGSEGTYDEKHAKIHPSALAVEQACCSVELQR